MISLGACARSAACPRDRRTLNGFERMPARRPSASLQGLQGYSLSVASPVHRPLSQLQSARRRVGGNQRRRREAAGPALRTSTPLRVGRWVDPGTDFTPLDCTEENINAVVEEFRRAAWFMLGCHEPTAAIGITGDVVVKDVEGPFVTVSLVGRFWHRRSTVLANLATFMCQRIPEVLEVNVSDPAELEDVVTDDAGNVLVDRRSPDYNGDRATMEYQGIDPDLRGPFGDLGGFSAGGSMFT